MKKKSEKQRIPIPQHPKPNTSSNHNIISSSHHHIYFYFALALSFLVTFIFYVLTLAPTISFEDSGELVTAAYSLGVPHEPGYPLFTIIGKIFTILIPFGSIAYRVNLESAFFTSLACLFVTYSTILLIEDTHINSKPETQNSKPETRNSKLETQNSKPETPNTRLVRYLIGLGSGLFFGFSLEPWRQAVMTEVYGLNSCFVALFILLVLIWKRQKTVEGRKKYLYVISFIIAICITNHTTSLMLLPIFGTILLVVDFKLLFNLKTFLKTSLFFILGFTPYLYLPVASLRKPVMNWGNPDNLTNLYRVITRSQYRRTGDSQAISSFIDQFKFYLNHLVISQWYPIFLIFAVIGIIIIYRLNRKYFWFALMFLIWSMPIMAYATNFDVTGNTESSLANQEMVAVFYIPSYMLLSVLIGIGFFYIISMINSSFRSQVLSLVSCVLILLMALSAIFKNFKDADMSHYYYPQKYFNNISKVAAKGSIIMGDLDYYTFPFFYYQYVENKRKDLVSLDINLLKRSWYIDLLKIHHPEVIMKSQNEVEKFLTAVAPFESGGDYNGNVIQVCYENMIHSFIDNNLKSGKDVYITYVNKETQQIISKYPMEPVYAAFKIVRESKITNVNYRDFELNDFIVPINSDDQILNKFDMYYGDIILSRANMFYKLKDKNDALTNYSLALPFFKNDANFQNYINRAIQQLQVESKTTNN